METNSEVPAITRIDKLLIQLAVTVTVRKCCFISSEWAPTTCRWHVQYLFSDVYWVFSNICVSRVISHSRTRSLRRLTVESVCGARLRSKTTYAPFCSYRGHVLYTCLCCVDVRNPWIVDLPFPWNVYAVVSEALFILVRLFVVWWRLVYIYKNWISAPFELTARSISLEAPLRRIVYFLLCCVSCKALFKPLWWEFERSEPT